MAQKLMMIIVVLLMSCSFENTYKDVGDIAFNELMDDENFKICNENNIKQYYARKSTSEPAQYKGEKRALEEAILNQYKFPISSKETGYVTIRFIVNCEGNMGRFRVEGMNLDYQPYDFDSSLVEQLLNAVKKLDGWIPVGNGDKMYDFYQYLTFKIKDGQILKILP